jgi:hypothetical protein
MRFFYFPLLLLCVVALIPQSSAAVSLEEMMGSLSGKEVKPDMPSFELVAGGECGNIAGIMGCPADGGKLTPPALPELLTVMEAMPRLMNPKTATTEDKLELLRTANKLGKLTPLQIEAQLATLASAPSSQRLAILPRAFPLAQIVQNKDSLKATELLIHDATTGGAQMERGLRQARQFLASIEPTVTHINLKRELRLRIAGIDALIKAGSLSQVAKQSFGIFYDSHGVAQKNPVTNKPITPAQISSALLLMSLDNSLQDTGGEPLPVTSADPAALSLDHF